MNDIYQKLLQEQKSINNELKVNYKILQMHFVQQLYSKKNNYFTENLNISDQLSQLRCEFFQINELSKIDYFLQKTSVTEYDEQFYYPNKNLLKLFLTSPYFTSIKILQILLKNSGIKNLQTVLFSTLRIDDEKYKIRIDPSIYFLIDKSLITPKNVQTISLSLWILFDVWMGDIQQKITLLNKKQSKLSQPTNNSQFFNRSIYTLNQNPFSSKYKLQLKKQTPKMSIKQFQTSYKTPLKYNILFWLLSFQIQSTMLKYWFIQNDLFQQYLKSDFICSLLIHNSKFLFKDQNQNKRQIFSKKNKEFTQKYEKALINKIQNIQNIEQLQSLETQIYGQINDDITRNKINQKQQNNLFLFNNHPDHYQLPWMKLITRKNIILQLLDKKNGYKLILEILKRRPLTFQKIYGETIFTSIFIKFDRFLKQKSFGNLCQYKRRGNPNVKSKQQIYLMNNSRNMFENQFDKINLTKQELTTMKQILKFYIINGNDSNIKTACQKFLIAMKNY